MAVENARMCEDAEDFTASLACCTGLRRSRMSICVERIRNRRQHWFENRVRKWFGRQSVMHFELQTQQV